MPERIIAESISHLHSATKVQMPGIQIIKRTVSSVRQDEKAAPVNPKSLIELELTNEF